MNAAPPVIALRSGTAAADVSPLGAELRRWRSHGRELLWSGDARWWPRTSPVLFPIVGALNGGHVRLQALQERRVAMPRHGFAATQRFEAVEVRDDAVTLALTANAATRECYPFEFELRLGYRVHDGGLDVTVELTNRGAEAMPYALGLHPGFNWPFSAAAPAGHAIVFEQAEATSVPVITAEGLISPARRGVPLDGRRLALDAALFEADALCFLDARSQRLRFDSPDGAAIVVTADGFAHWALWSRPGAPFLCIEAWTGHADPEGFDGELADKPSMRQLAPGATAAHRVGLRFEPAGSA